MLLSWLRYYDWLLSGKGPKVPDDDILNDDDLLDEYVDNWKRDLERREKEANKPTGSKGKTNNFTIG